MPIRKYISILLVMLLSVSAMADNDVHDYTLSEQEEKKMDKQITTIDMDEIIVEFVKDEVKDLAIGIAVTETMKAVLSSEQMKAARESASKAMKKLENVPIIGGITSSAADLQYMNAVLHFNDLIDSVSANTKQIKESRKKRLELFSKGVSTGCNILDCAENVYEIYRTMMSYVETAGAVFLTCKELKKLEESLVRMEKLYEDCGARFAPYSLYDLDKYLNPLQQKYYAREVNDIHEDLLRITRQVGVVTDVKKTSNIKAGDNWRLNEIRRLTVEISRLEIDMYEVMDLFSYLVRANIHHEAMFELKETMWNFWDYSTYSVW